MFLFLVALAAIIFIIYKVVSALQSRHSTPTTYTTSNPSQSEPEISSLSRRQRIASEVSDSFYNEVQSFCQRNSMTVSDLIRKSVREYMDHNKS